MFPLFTQIRTISSIESHKMIALTTTSIFIAIGLFLALVISVCVLAFALFCFRSKRRIQRQSMATVTSFGGVKPSMSTDLVGGGGCVVMEEIELDHSVDDYITYRHFSLPSNDNMIYS